MFSIIRRFVNYVDDQQSILIVRTAIELSPLTSRIVAWFDGSRTAQQIRQEYLETLQLALQIVTRQKPERPLS